MSAYSKRTQALVAALLLALGFAIGFASMQQAYADEGDDAPNTPIKAAGIDLSSLSQGLYTVAGFQVDDKEDHDGAINVDPTDGPAYIYVDASGNAMLLVRVYNPNKYDYIWKGKVADRPSSNATDQMIPGTPLFADTNYIANGMHKGNIFNDTTGVYGILGASYKAMYFEIPVTSDEIASGKVYFCIRCTPGLTDEGGQWMDSNDHFFLIQTCEPVAGVDTSTWQLKPANIKEAITLANAIPQVPDASDLATYVPAREAYIALDYSATQDYGRAFLDAVIPEVKAKLDATDAAIPDIVPADGTYVFTQTLPGSVYPGTAVPFVSDSLWSTVMTVENGKMTLQIAQRRGSYGYVYAGLPSEALAAQTAAGDSGKDASHTPGASNFKNVVSVYLDNPLSGSNPVDGTITFDGPGVYPMYAGTIEIPSLEKPVALSFLGTSWYNRSFVFTQENMFTEGAVNCIRLINKLVNSPEPEGASSEVTPYKVDAALLSNADEAITKAAVDAYLALNDTDRTTIDSRVILSTPEGAADAQTYFQALGVAVEKFGISLEEAIQVDVPVAATDLVYNGEEQIGVAASKGYTVESGSAVEAGDYVATASLLPGYVWADGTFGDKLVAWSIAPASDIPAIDIEAYGFDFSANNNYLGTDVLAGAGGEDTLIEALDLSLYYWNDDGESVYLKYGTDFLVSGWYRWDDDEFDCYRLDSYPTEEGEYQVEIEGVGRYTGVLSASFDIYDAYDVGRIWYLEFDSGSEVAYEGGALVYPAFTVYDNDDDPVDPAEYDVVVYRDDDDDYGEVADGEMTRGRYELRIVPAEGSLYHGYTWDTFWVYDPYDVDGLRVRLDKSAFGIGEVPTGFAPMVYAADDETLLKLGVDYTLGYQRLADGDECEFEDIAAFDGNVAGVYRFVITGQDPYHGTTHSKDFRVIDYRDVANAEMFGLDDLGVKLGAKVTPSVSVKTNGVFLDEGYDYTVAYYVATPKYDDEGCISGYTRGKAVTAPLGIGCYEALIAGIGEYSGTLSDHFYVRDASDLRTATFELKRRGYTYTGNPVVLDYTITAYDGTELVLGKDYRLTYALWDELAGEDDQGDVVGPYTNVAPTDILDDWETSYVVYAEGMGEYSGETRYWRFEIVESNDLDGAIIELDSDMLAYTGSKNVPSIKVLLADPDGTTTLVEGRDYNVHYEGEYINEEGFYCWGPVDSPTDISEYRVYIRATEDSDYRGGTDAPFYIYMPMKGAKVTADDQEYTGRPLRPKVTVTLDGKVVPSDFYDVAYSNNVYAGTATVTVTSRDYCMESATGTFQITGGPTPPAPVVKIDVPIAVTDLVYNGEVQVGVAVGEGYTVESGSAVEAGDYVATVSLLPGYVWADGTSDDKLVAWSIASASDIPTIDIETDEFSFYADSDWLGTDVLVGLDGEEGLIEVLDLNLRNWNDDDSDFLEYGKDFRVSGWYRWDDDEDDYVALDSYPTDAGDYKVEVEGIGRYTGVRSASFGIYDAYDVNRLWIIELSSFSVEYAGGSIVYPDFRVFAYDDYGDEVDIDASEYTVKVIRMKNSDMIDEWLPTDEEVAEGEMTPGYYCLRIIPVEESPYHGYLQDDEEGSFRVSDSGSVSEANVDLDEYEFFVGELPKGFGPTVSVYDEDEEESVLLKEGVDYTLGVQKDCSADGDESDWRDFKGFDGTVAGHYRFVITGKGSYHGEAYSYSFLIADRNDIGYAEVEILNDLLVKSGSKATPELEVTLHGTVLAEGADYSVTYYVVTREGEDWDYEWVRGDKATPPLGVGHYEAEIKGLGAYNGTLLDRFGVFDKNDLGVGDFELNQSTYAYTGEPVKLDCTVRAADGTELVFGKDYRLLYGLWDDLGGEDDSGAISGEVSETPPTEMISSSYYDYYAVYAEGIGEYSGQSYTRTFNIVEPGDIAAAVFKFSNPAVAKTHEVAYTGRAAAPKFTLVMPGKNGDTTLVEGRDYTVAYCENSGYDDEYVDAPTAVGQYTIIVRGIGEEYGEGYFGSKHFYFNIGKPLANARVAVADQDYTGKKLKPAVTVVLDGRIVPADCYWVEYANNVGPGTATVTVTACEYDDDGDYTGVIGSGTGTFRIVDRAADKAAADAAIAKINAIGTVTANSGDAIAAARAAYNALTADQKALVSAAQLAKLTSAESAYKKAVADAEVAEAAAKLTAASTINAATVKAADIKKASNLGATTVTLGPKVKKIAKNAFKGTKITTVVVKSKKLTKKSVKNAFKGSKVKTVKVPKSKKKAYKKIFTKKVVGKKVKVK